MDKYIEMFGQFDTINPIQAQEKIDNNEEVIIFVGRISCPYCRKFVRKLIKVKDKHEVNILYMDTEDEDFIAEGQNFREKYQIETVPGLVFAHNGEVKVVTDSSLKNEEIEAFIGL